MPTISASRLSAVRFSSKAAVICSIAWVRSAGRVTRKPAGKIVAIRSSAGCAASPSGRIRSICVSLPSMPSHSCAVATSATSRLSIERRAASSCGSSSATSVAVSVREPTRIGKLSPLFSP